MINPSWKLPTSLIKLIFFRCVWTSNGTRTYMEFNGQPGAVWWANISTRFIGDVPRWPVALKRFICESKTWRNYISGQKGGRGAQENVNQEETIIGIFKYFYFLSGRCFGKAFFIEFSWFFFGWIFWYEWNMDFAIEEDLKEMRMLQIEG